MKATGKVLLVIVLTAVLASFILPEKPEQAAAPALPRASDEIRMGQVLALSEFSIRDDVDPAVFEKFIVEQYHPAWKNHVSGAQYLVFKGDRGVRDGEYLSVYNFDTLERRNYYYPQEDAGPYPEADAATAPIQPVIDQYQEYLSAARVYTDYVLVGRDKVEDLPTLQLIGVHRLTIKEGMEDAFERFVVEKLHPAWAKHVPGARLFVLKGDRGLNKGGYIALYTFEPASTRDKYFPEPEMPSAAFEEAFRPMEKLEEEMISYFKYGEDYMDYVSFTDYVLLQ